MESKPALRERLSLVRAARSPAGRQAAGLRLAEHGVSAWGGLSLVAAYASVDAEPPTEALLDGLLAAGVTVWLPVIDGTALGWAPYEGWDRLVEAPMGLRRPTGPPIGPAGLARADLVVVPALAVDDRGNRLGRGGGYYDRALAGNAVPTVAVVFDDEIVDAVPIEAHDVPVDAMLSPAGLVAVTRDDARSVPGAVRGG
jgi:5-formyltetrahydrofolate cyclo-ligase